MKCDVMPSIGPWEREPALAQNGRLLGKSAPGLGGVCCASAVRGLSSNHTLKPLVPTLCLVVVVIYGLGDKLRNFVAGIFIPQYHYPYAVALCFAQVVISLLVLNLLHVLNLVPLKPYSRPLGEKVLVPSISLSVQSVVSMWARDSSSRTGLFPLLMPLLPLLTAALSYSLKLTPPPSVHVSVLVSFLSGMCVVTTASRGLSNMEPVEYIYAPLSLILHSLSLTWLAKVSEAERHRSPDSKVSIFDIYYTTLVNQSCVLGLLWLLHPHSPWQVLSRGSWHSLLFHGYLFAILLMGMVLDFLVGIVALSFSPLAAATLHSTRELVQPFFRLV